MTPTADFVGALEQTNRRLIWLMFFLVLLESRLIYVTARKIAQPIEIVFEAIERIRSLSSTASRRSAHASARSPSSQKATILLESTLRSFSVFVPVGLVRDLIDSGKPIAPFVEPRFMTIFFSDLENFTTTSEQLSPQELSEQTSRCFEIVTAAVSEEEGAIDKFIGDSGMAFWGAPAAIDDHAYRACVAALKAIA